MDRRVLCVHAAGEVGRVGLITCVWSWVTHSARHPTPASGPQGFSLELLPMDVVDAEGLDLEQVGEDKTCGKEQSGMFSNDIKERDRCEHKMMTRTLFTLKHLEPCRGRMSAM